MSAGWGLGLEKIRGREPSAVEHTTQKLVHGASDSWRRVFQVSRVFVLVTRALLVGVSSAL